jgi:NADH dehydrogenase/NADH:ubiquinone oxidoreductase subunit G
MIVDISTVESCKKRLAVLVAEQEDLRSKKVLASEQRAQLHAIGAQLDMILDRLSALLKEDKNAQKETAERITGEADRAVRDSSAPTVAGNTKSGKRRKKAAGPDTGGVVCQPPDQAGESV